MAAEREKYRHNGGKFVRDMNNRKNCRRYRWNFTDMNKLKEFKNSNMDLSVENPAEIKSTLETERIRKNRLNHQ